jgi:hypothetical protein
MKVSEVLRMLAEDGWFLVATKSSHRQFKHRTKIGAGHGRRQAKRRFGSGDTQQYPEAVRIEEVR